MSTSLPSFVLPKGSFIIDAFGPGPVQQVLKELQPVNEAKPRVTSREKVRCFMFGSGLIISAIIVLI